MALRGTNQEFGRPYNRRIVLETIRVHGPITRADIARKVGLTIQTVSTIIRELEEQGFILARREEPRGRGSPASTFAIDPTGGFAIGLHVTPRGIEAALINLAGEVIGRDDRALPGVDADTAFTEIRTLVDGLSALQPDGRMLGVGMAMPGPFGVESMSFVGPTTLQGWKDVPVRDRLAAATGLPAFIEVDLAAAAHGERLYGLGSDFRDFYYLYFGVGLGGSMVHDGVALRGAWGNAGEIGHIPVVPGGDPCPCGNRGCLERYLSLEAYERRAKMIGEAAWLDEVAPILRSAVVTIENLFDPATIILGGLVPNNLLAKLIEAAEPLPNSIASRGNRRAKRLISSAGHDAVLRGAAAVAVSGVLSPRFGIMFTQSEDRADRDPIMRDAGKARAA
ncbi:ROK family transcriptional regulator [Bauldia litoralis]|uniref:Sugar kinase of the NBD/HSP70 family, may contain an N-terminal HTH domain n=1 Tax=Bauldia litoralis TaxID=665467 RepID=A0A1G6E4P9_9HYPH|nr:ROK family transcriptional regulator [Bauldia litoralis]SDB52348.1 Sugar kinase of the NBD/HSP70 family, may contain an N-terminal HTH domain [Bauldia litoralis]